MTTGARLSSRRWGSLGLRQDGMDSAEILRSMAALPR